MRNIFTIFFIAYFCLVFVVFPSDINAGNLWLQPSIGGRGEYNDNVLFTKTEKEEDFIFIISPAAELSYKSDLVDVESNVVLDILEYTDRTDLNTVNQLYEFNGRYRFRPRWSFTGLISYVKDTTLDSYLLETGRVSEREDRDRFDADTGLIYQLTELSEIGFNYHFKDVKYGSDFYVDYDRHSATLSYNKKMKDQVNTIGSQLAYYYRDSEVSDLTEYIFQMSLDHIFSSQTRFFVSAGASFSEQDFKDDRNTETHLRPIGHTFIAWQGEILSLKSGYRRDIRTDTNGQAIDLDRIYCRLKRKLTERAELELDGKFYYSTDIDQSYRDGTRFYELEPKFIYKLTENHALHLAYQYSNEKDNEKDNNKTGDRHRIWLSLNFNFPKLWEF